MSGGGCDGSWIWPSTKVRGLYFREAEKQGGASSCEA